MAREWQAKCKDCGRTFGYSDSSQELSNQRGLSRPERCPECRKLHSREIASLGLSHYELTPIVPLPAGGLKPGRLGGVIHDRPRAHQAVERRPTFDITRFSIKDQHVREFFEELQRHQVMVIVAPTGSGKSTFLPYRLMVPPEGLDADLFTRHGPIVVTQPRIQATRNIPLFVARDLHGSSLGPGFDVGFRHSGNTATDWRNKLIYMTDGTLINMIVRNELNRIGVIMIDEAHERSLNIDLILGLLRHQLRRYPHLKLIIASATIDTRLFVQYYGAPASFDPDQHKSETPDGVIYDNHKIATQLADFPVGFYGFPGKRQHPVEVRFREDNPIPAEQMSGRMPEEVADKVVEVLKAIDEGREPRGDVLAFLHGEKPIERAVAEIRAMVDEDARLSTKVDVLPLYTKLPQESQNAALLPKKRKERVRVVVSTNVAETSLTVEGIVHVVDSGLINESQWDPQTQTEFVVPKIHSRAGCTQRWGRAGRVQPGIAHCLYTKEQFEKVFPSHTDPEIMRAPLEQIVLTAKAAGIEDIAKFEWIQSPSPAELARAPQVLRQIGALDSYGDLTEHGLELRSFSEDTDVANLMIIADRFGCAIEMATLIPMLKLGGYARVLRWDKGWNATTKRAVHRIHLGLIGSCDDDLEFALKLWSAWEAKRYSSDWAERFFVDNGALGRIRQDREALLESLLSRKKDTKLRPLDFDLLTRLRILLTYGMPSQVYELVNLPKESEVIEDIPVYRPFVTDANANPELLKLHADATVEITPSSVCFGRAPELFVCGSRQRLRRRMSPQLDPATVITASFVTLIKPEWLRVIGQPPIAVARMVAAETRNEQGQIRASTTRKRLMIDQTHRVGATFRCMSGGGTIILEAEVKSPPKLRVASSYEDVEIPEQVEVLEAEGALDERLGAEESTRDRKGSATRKQWSEVRESHEDEGGDPIWLDLVESEAGPDITLEAVAGTAVVTGRLSGDQQSGTFEAVVTGYVFTSHLPVVLLEMPRQPDPFAEFKRRYKVADEITVVVEGIEEYVNDLLSYLIVREIDTGLEIVMDPYDASLIGRNFAIEGFEIGNRFQVNVEEVGDRSVRVTRLKSSVAALESYYSKSEWKVVDAEIAEVRDNGLYLGLGSVDGEVVGAFVRLDKLPNRPTEMWLHKACRARVRPQKRKEGFKHSFGELSPEIEQSLLKRIGKERWAANLKWDQELKTLIVPTRMSYEQRRALLDFGDDPAYRRGINKLFRRTNELEAQVIDTTGLEELVPHQAAGTRIPARVVSVHHDAVYVEFHNGLEVRVPRSEVSYDRNADLTVLFTNRKDELAEATVKEVNVEQGTAFVSLLRPEDDPLRKYKEDDRGSGTVVGFTKEGEGAFVELEPGVEGFLYKDEIQFGRVDDARAALQKGQTIKFRITEVDYDSRKMRLTARALYEATVMVPLSHINLVVGAGGRTIQDLESTTSTRINLDKASGECVITGLTKESVYTAEQRIRALTQYRIVTFALMQTQQRGALFGMIEGRNVRTIQVIQEETDTQINVNDMQVVVTAPDDYKLRSALDKIRDAVRSCVAVIKVEAHVMGRVIGAGGSTIKSIRETTNVRIDASKDGSGQITLTSNDAAKIERAIELIKLRAGVTIQRLSLNCSEIGQVTEIQPTQPRPVIKRSKPSQLTSERPEPATAKGPAGPVQSARPITTPAPQPSQVYEQTLSLNSQQVANLTRKRGALLSLFLGGSQSALEKIQAKTMSKIELDTTRLTVKVVARSQEDVRKVMDEIRRAAS